MFIVIFLFLFLFYFNLSKLNLVSFCRLEIGAGMNFAIMAKFIPVTHGLLGTLQLPNSFIKRGPPLIFIPLHPHSSEP